MPTIPTSALLSGSTVLVQLQAAADGAIAVGASVYQSLNLLHRTTVLDVRHEFATLTATLDQVTANLNDFPADTADHHQVLNIAPKGLALCSALSRTTAALQTLSGKVSQEDGVALLASYKEVEGKANALFVVVNSRLPAFEVGVPGIVHHGLTRLNDLFQALAQALISVLPASINPDEVHSIHATIQVSVDSSFSRLGSLQSS